MHVMQVSVEKGPAESLCDWQLDWVGGGRADHGTSRRNVKLSSVKHSDENNTAALLFYCLTLHCVGLIDAPRSLDSMRRECLPPYLTYLNFAPDLRCPRVSVPWPEHAQCNGSWPPYLIATSLFERRTRRTSARTLCHAAVTPKLKQPSLH